MIHVSELNAFALLHHHLLLSPSAECRDALYGRHIFIGLLLVHIITMMVMTTVGIVRPVLMPPAVHAGGAGEIPMVMVLVIVILAVCRRDKLTTIVVVVIVIVRAIIAIPAPAPSPNHPTLSAAASAATGAMMVIMMVVVVVVVVSMMVVRGCGSSRGRATERLSRPVLVVLARALAIGAAEEIDGGYLLLGHVEEIDEVLQFPARSLDFPSPYPPVLLAGFVLEVDLIAQVQIRNSQGSIRVAQWRPDTLRLFVLPLEVLGNRMGNQRRRFVRDHHAGFNVAVIVVVVVVVFDDLHTASASWTSARVAIALCR